MPTIKCGIFGQSEVEVDDEGYITLTVLIAESGLFVGAPPEEIRINTIIPPWMEDGLVEIVADINKKRDLPLYIKKARIKVL